MLPLFHYYSSIELPQMWAIAHALLGGMLVRYGYELYVLADQMEDN